jgi:hypothetical protein
LDVAEDRDAGVFAQAIFEHSLHVISGHGLAVDVARAFGDEHDAGPAADAPAGPQHVTHRRLPVGARRALGDEHEVGAGCQAAHQGEVAAVASHHLDDERALVAGGRTLQRVDGLGDPVQGGVGADRHVGAEHVVVDRPDEADERQLAMGIRLFPVDRPVEDQVVQQFWPLPAELGGTAEAAVAADDDEGVDVALDEVPCRSPPAVSGPEVGAARGPEDGPALVENPAHVRR